MSTGGAITGAAIGGLFLGPLGAIVGAGVGSKIGEKKMVQQVPVYYPNPTLIYDQHAYPIMVKKCSGPHQEFKDLHDRVVNYEQLQDVETFFTTFNASAATKGIERDSINRQYFFADAGFEHALDIDALKYHQYHLQN